MNLPELKQLGRDPLHERVWLEIKSALTSGRFVPGQRLTVRGLAKALNTSAMPVRTAVGKLVAQGALEQLNNGFLAVPVVTRETFNDLMTMRMTLEGMAAANATRHIMPADIEKIAGLAKELDSAWAVRDIDKYLRLNEMFKFEIYSHCDSGVLKELISLLWLRIGPFLRSLRTHYSDSPQIHFHNETITALRNRDADGARHWMETDIRQGRDFLLANAEFADRQPESTANEAPDL